MAQAPQTTPDAQKPVAVINGEVITAYNLNKAKFGLPQDIIDYNSKDSSRRRNVRSSPRSSGSPQAAAKTAP